jgi:hypothetical protein
LELRSVLDHAKLATLHPDRPARCVIGLDYSRESRVRLATTFSALDNILPHKERVMRFFAMAWLVFAGLGCSTPLPPTSAVTSPSSKPTTEERSARIEAISLELIRLFNAGEDPTAAGVQVPAFQQRMMAIANEGVDDACGREALIWVLAHAKFSPASEIMAGRAADLLIAHHLTQPQMRFACRHIASLAAGAEERLRVIQAGTTDDATRGAALLALAEVLSTRGNVITRTADREKLHREAVNCLDEVVRKYPDLRLCDRAERYEDLAERLLDQVRRIAVGCPAPEIEGETLEGKKLRLSDYRGRVVMLVFGKAGCPGCVALYPRQRALLQRLTGCPFEVVGVHAGEEKDRAGVRAMLKQNQVSWPTVWSRGPVGHSTIETLWSVDGYPTIYLIDAGGVIQFKSLGSPDGTVLEDTVAAMMKDAEDRKSSTK